MSDLLREIWESLRQNKFRTAMTGFAVVWGIFILVVLLGVSNGLENGMHANYGSRLSNSVDVWSSWTSIPYKGLPKERYMFFNDNHAQIIRSMPEVELFSRVVSKYNVETVYSKESITLEVVGVESDYQHIFNKRLLSGRFVNARDIAEREKVGVLDERAIEMLGVTADQILGAYIKVSNVRFRIVGVCEKGDRWQGASIYIPFSTHQSIFSTYREFGKMCMTMTSGTRDIEKKVKNLLAGPMQFDKDDPRAIGVWTQEESVEEQGRVMGAIRLFILLLGLCTLISGAVGVSNIMLVSVRERTKELGIRKALGAPPATIMWSVVGESLIITTFFGFVGVLIGSGVVAIIRMVVANSQGAEQVLQNPSVDLGAILIATLILVIIGVIAGAIPAYRAMRIKPIEAMNADK
ncbi:MAG: ABC transporter permease [Paludibacteraceae bacterium]|jgi:putative ABC transport system permease protein|nr:ABC transporter permease [Paludibacteraceae bacterium]